MKKYNDTILKKIGDLEEVLEYKELTIQDRAYILEELRKAKAGLSKKEIVYSPNHGIYKGRKQDKYKKKHSSITLTSSKKTTNKKLRQDKLFSKNGNLYKLLNQEHRELWY